MRAIFALTIAGTILASCGRSPMAATIGITGTWSGMMRSYPDSELLPEDGRRLT
jgi:hypothetical protein